MRIIALLFLVTIQITAAESWKLPLFSSSPAEVFDAAHQFPPRTGTDVYLVDLQVTIGIDAQGRESRTQRGIYRVVNEIGAKQFARLSEPWLAWRQNKPEIRVRVITSDKQEHLLDPTTITEASLPGHNDMYGDVKLLQAPLPGIAADCVVEMETKSGDREAVMPGERYDTFRVLFAYPVRHMVLEFEPNAQLTVHARGFDPAPSQTAVGGRTRFEAWDLPRFQAKLLLPPEAPSGPEIQYTTTQSWQDVARWYTSATEPVIGVANPADAGKAIDVAKVSEILAAIQDKVRYTALELGMGAYVPRRPEQTLERRYGDCKDKATLLINHLRMAGIPAKLALLVPYPFPDVNPSVPGMEAFNHVVVYLPGARPLWIDPTAQYAPATRLPVNDQGRNALIVDPGTTALVKTPESDADASSLTELLTIRLQAHGKAEKEGEETYVGGNEDGLRSTFAALGTPSEIKTRFNSQVKQVFQSEKLERMGSSNPSRLGEPFVISYAASGWDGAITEHGTARAVVALGAKSIGPLAVMANAAKPTDKDEKDAGVRREDFYIQNLQTFERRFNVIPPPGFAVSRVPEAKTIDLGVLKINSTSSLKMDNTVVVTYQYKIAKHRYTFAEASELAKKIEESGHVPDLSVMFVDSAEKLLTEGKDREALAVARARVQADPHDASSHLRLATTLSALGLNSEAIRSARKAIELDAPSAEAFATLAELYTRDEMGRQFRPGMQLDLALAAQKKALELAPDDKRIALDLSRYYEYNENGERYGPGAHLRESIATLEKIEKDLPKLNARDRLPAVMFFDHRYAKVKSYEEAGHGGGLALAYQLAAVAILDGMEPARAAFERSGTGSSRYTAFGTAARAAMGAREYAAASQLFHEADQERGDSASAQELADMLAKTSTRSSAKFSDDPAVGVVQRLIYALLQFRENAEWHGLFVPEWRDLAFRAERNELSATLTAFHFLAGQNMPIWLMADLAVSNAAMTSEGSDRVGYRVRFADPNHGGSSKTVAWVVKRGNEYLVAGLANDVAIAGSEALKAAQAGDLDSARQWLDWVREDETPPVGLDPLTGMAFQKLWPVENATREDVLLAAASLASRGKHYEAGMAALREISKTAGPEKRSKVDWALMQAGVMHHLIDETVEPAKRLTKAYPGSDIAVAEYAAALHYSGQSGAAAAVIASRLATNPTAIVVLRERARLLGAQADFSGAAQAFRQAARAPKSTAQDWNMVAWSGLFTVPPQTDAVEAANTAVHLTQERNAPVVHTLGCAQALSGDTASARKQLYRYLDLAGVETADEASRLLFGLIAAQLGFADEAREQFAKMEKPQFEAGLSDYELAKRQLPATKLATGK